MKNVQTNNNMKNVQTNNNIKNVQTNNNSIKNVNSVVRPIEMSVKNRSESECSEHESYGIKNASKDNPYHRITTLTHINNKDRDKDKDMNNKDTNNNNN